MRSKSISMSALAVAVVATAALLFIRWNQHPIVFLGVCLGATFGAIFGYQMWSGFKKLTLEVLELRRENKVLAGKTSSAEGLSQTKSQFLANMSHEIRTPLSAILGFVELMDDPNLPDEERLAFSKIIRSNSEYLIKVVNDILDISKIESGSLAIKAEETRVIKVISSVVAMMKVKAKEKDLKLLTEYWSELPEFVLLDECRVRQILVNLIGNAIKFTKQGGVSLHVGCYPGKKPGFVSLEMIVRDTGEGLAQEQREQLFSMFTQVNTEFGDRPIGTGLGLALSRRLANMMDGEVSILESTPGKGSSFIFTLPVQVKQQGIDQEPISLLSNFSSSGLNPSSSWYV